MTIVDCEKQEATIIVNYDELGILNNALNEVCNALDIAEFSTRMGADLDEVKELLRQVNALGVSMQQKGANWGVGRG